jgi:hypothetical protein
MIKTSSTRPWKKQWDKKNKKNKMEKQRRKTCIFANGIRF